MKTKYMIDDPLAQLAVIAVEHAGEGSAIELPIVRGRIRSDRRQRRTTESNVPGQNETFVPVTWRMGQRSPVHRAGDLVRVGLRACVAAVDGRVTELYLHEKLHRRD